VFDVAMRKRVRTVEALGLLALVVASVFSVGFHHFDEHFQILEFAGLKLGLTSEESLPWEYHHRMRSSLQPALAVAACRGAEILGVRSPFAAAFFLRLVSALLAFVCMRLLYAVYCGTFRGAEERWFLALSFLSWPAVFVGVRYSGENWAGLFFTLAFAACFLTKRSGAPAGFLVGTLLGLSFVFRFQAALLAAGLLAWLVLVKKAPRRHMAGLAVGMAAAVAAGILVDRWFYGEWTLAAWNYFDQNILQGKAASFGESPWWWYIRAFALKGIPPLSLLFLLAVPVAAFSRPRSPVLWSVLPFLAVHFAIGHKELRFLFPMVYFLPVLLVTAFEGMRTGRFSDVARLRTFRAFMACALAVNCACLAVAAVGPADGRVSLYRKIYDGYPGATLLYCHGEDPYRRVGLDVRFYRRGNLEVRTVRSPGEIRLQPDRAHLWVSSDRDALRDHGTGGNLVYASHPAWLLRLNVNNWVGRSKIWYLYELDAAPGTRQGAP